jgi:hypothetical protein
MKISKKTTCLLLILSFSLLSFGQKNKEARKVHKEKVKAMKIAYITEKVDLTPEEAQSFWPVYNEYSNKRNKIHRSIKQQHKKETTIDEMTDSDVDKMINTTQKLHQEEVEMQLTYLENFKELLPIKKVAKLYKAEHDFKKELLKKLRVKKGGPNELNIPPPPTPEN